MLNHIVLLAIINRGFGTTIAPSSRPYCKYRWKTLLRKSYILEGRWQRRKADYRRLATADSGLPLVWVDFDRHDAPTQPPHS